MTRQHRKQRSGVAGVEITAALGILGVLGLAVLVAYLMREIPVVEFEDAAGGKILRQLQILAILAIFVERTVEVYRTIVDQRQRAMLDDAERADDIRRSTLGALVLAFTLSIGGVRALAPAIKGDATTLIHGVDVLISAGLLVGGSALIREIIDGVMGFVDTTRLRARSERLRLQRVEAQLNDMNAS